MIRKLLLSLVALLPVGALAQTVPLGDFPAGSTMYVPFNTYDSNGASVTITGLAVTDIEIYKNGGTTQRASDAGYALLDTDGIDFDATTGLHGFSIDLSDNTDAGFYAAGSQYWLNVNAVTVDSQTVNFTYYFRIISSSWFDLMDGTTSLLTSEHAGLELETTVGTVISQTELILAGGATNDDAYPKGSIIVIEGGAEKGTATVENYIGSTAAVFLSAAMPFTVEVGDEVRIHSGASPVMLAAVEDDTSTSGVAIKTDGVNAAAVSVDAVSELQSGIATSTAVGEVQSTADTIDGKIDTAQSDLDAMQDGSGPVWVVGQTLFTGTADGGATVSLDDAALTQASDYWNDGAAVTFLSGAFTGMSRCVSDFDGPLDRLSFTPQVPGSVTAGDTYAIIAAPSCGAIRSGGINTNAWVNGAITAAAIAPDAIGASQMAADASGEIADSVWTEAIADHSGTAGSTAEQLAAAGSAGDPWATALPGSYTAGQAGKIVGDNLNATVSSRAAPGDAMDLAAGAVDAAAIATGAIDADALAGDAITAAKIAPDAIGSSELAATGANEVRDAIMDYVLDNGITFEQAACHMLAVLAGESAFTDGSPDQNVFSDPTGTNVRVTVQYGTDAGDRTSVTLSATGCGS